MYTPSMTAISACWRWCAVAVLGGGAMSASFAADLSFANMFRNNAFAQTSDAGVGYIGSFFSAAVTAAGPTGATTGVLTVPTSPSSTQTLSSLDGVVFQYQTPLLSSQADDGRGVPDRDIQLLGRRHGRILRLLRRSLSGVRRRP